MKFPRLSRGKARRPLPAVAARCRMRGKNVGLSAGKVRLLEMESRGDEDVAGRPGYEVFKPRGLIAVRCGPPSGSSPIYEAIGIAEWRYF